jgi:hypothetical protein
MLITGEVMNKAIALNGKTLKIVTIGETSRMNNELKTKA